MSLLLKILKPIFFQKTHSDPANASIRGEVFVDRDGNGLDDKDAAGDVRVVGAQVDLEDAHGNTIATTFTDANGQYAFNGLTAGQYRIDFQAGPYTTKDASNNVGETWKFDSDADEATGRTSLITLSKSEIRDKIDAGVLRGDGVVDGEEFGEVMGVGYNDSNAPTDGGGEVIGGTNDFIEGNGGNDTIDASAGNDTVYGGTGDDEITGGSGQDEVYGEEGNDTVTIALESGTNEFADGGTGNDSLILFHKTDANTDVFFDMESGGIGDLLPGGQTAINFENVTTQGGDDRIIGSDADNIINTDGGNDSIDGGLGDDTINGGDGNDTINGDGVVSGVRESFNWTLLNDQEVDDARSTPITQDTGRVTVTFTRPSDNTSHDADLQSNAINVSGIDSGSEVIDNTSSLGSTNTAEDGFGRFQWDFSQEVSDVSFRINDIDGGSIVAVRAFDAAGNPLVVDYDLGSQLRASESDGVAGAETIKVIGSGQEDPTDSGNSALVSIAGPVAKLVIDHDIDAAFSAAGIQVSDLFFDAPVADTTNGDDVITGGAGNDVIFGDDGTADDREVFEWSEVTPGAEETSFTQDTGLTKVTFTRGESNGVQAFDPLTDVEVFTGGIVGNGDPINATSSGGFLGGGGGGTNGNTKIKLAFDNPVENVSFNIADIDGSSTVQVDAFDENGNLINVDLAAQPNMTLVDSDGRFGADAAYDRDLNTQASEADGAITVTVPGPVTSIVVYHSGVGGAGANISDVYFTPTISVDDGEGGDDVITGGAGADKMFGEGGDDTFVVSSAADGAGDVIDGGNGPDQTTDNDTLDLRGAGDVTINDAADANDAGATAGTVTFADGSTLTFEGIEQILTDAATPDGTVDGEETGELMGAGYDDSNAPTDGGGDVIGNGDDSIDGNGGDDTIDGGLGNDTINGGNNDDSIDGNDGQDQLNGDAGQDTLNGGNDNDTLGGGDDNDLLNGDAGQDVLNGDAGQDTLNGGNDDDVLNGGDDDDLLNGDAGDDLLNGDQGLDTLNGGTGNDTLNGGGDDDILTGGAGADEMNGGDDDDLIIIDNASDAVGDVVDGGSGGTDNDTLDLRGAGPVEYVGLRPDSDGNGQDGVANILDPVTGAIVATVPFTNIETLLDDGPFVPGPDGTVDGEDTPETMGVGYDDSNAPTDGGGDQITNGPDDIDGNDGDDTINAGAGDDTVDGGNDDDLLDGGPGADIINGGNDSDTIKPTSAPEAFDDTVDGGSGGNDFDVLDLVGLGPVRIVNQTPDSNGNGTDGVVEFQDPVTGAVIGTMPFTEIEQILSDGPFVPGPDGTVDGEDTPETMGVGYDDSNAPTDGGGDQITNGPDDIDGNDGDDTINAGAGDDTVDGGNDDDLLDGGPGADIINGGNDSDTIKPTSAPEAFDDTVDGGSGGNDFDVLDLVGLGPVRIVNQTPDSNGNGTDGVVEFQDPVTGAVIGTMPFTEIEQILSDGPFVSGPDGIVNGEETGETMGVGYDDSNAPTDGGGDLITNGDDSIQGNGGDDTIRAGAGDDTVEGGDGVDRIRGDNGDDDIDGNDGNDILFGNNGMDTIDGGNGRDYIVGGADADVLNGDDDRDTIRISRASDADGDVVDGGSGGQDFDRLDLRGAGLVRVVSQTADSNGNGTDGVLDLVDASGNTLATLSYSEIEQLVVDGFFTGPPSDGTVDGEDTPETMGVGYDDSNAPTDGGGDQITNGSDVIDGNDGDDTIDAGAGNDTVNGGNDDDLLNGGAGVDVINGGNDSDTITVSSVSEGNNDTVNGGSGGNDFDVLDLIGVGPVQIITQVPDSDGNGTDGTVIFQSPTDGAPIGTLDFTNIEQILSDGPFVGGGGSNGIVDGTSGNDDMPVGFMDAEGDMITSGDDEINAGAGNDEISSGAGNDTIFGGDGDDAIRSGSGDDVVSGGVGHDLVFLGSGKDTFVFEAGDGGDRVANFQTGDDQVDLSAYGFSDFSQIQPLLSTTSNGRHTEIDLGGGDSIVIFSVTPDEFTAGDFIL